MFRYTKSNAKRDKIKTLDFNIPVNCICEKEVYILRAPFHGEAYVDFFKKVVPSLTTFSFTTQIRY